MSEYIKTDDVVKSINVLLDNVDASEDAMHKFCDSMNDIQKVEIVRCKDCKYGHLRDNTTRNSSIYCDFGIGMHKENYCSFGERAEE